MTGRETVHNKALSGTEVKELLRLDFEKMLENEGLLSYYVAYGRISYDITLRLHLDNPMQRESTITAASKPSDKLPGVESAPLSDPSAKSVAGATNLHRDIKSPNEERLRHGLTLPVITHQQDGTTQTEQVKYPPQPELGPGEMTLSDVTRDARAAWKLADILPTP